MAAAAAGRIGAGYRWGLLWCRAHEGTSLESGLNQGGIELIRQLLGIGFAHRAIGNLHVGEIDIEIFQGSVEA